MKKKFFLFSLILFLIPCFTVFSATVLSSSTFQIVHNISSDSQVNIEFWDPNNAEHVLSSLVIPVNQTSNLIGTLVAKFTENNKNISIDVSWTDLTYNNYLGFGPTPTLPYTMIITPPNNTSQQISTTPESADSQGAGTLTGEQVFSLTGKEDGIVWGTMELLDFYVVFGEYSITPIGTYSGSMTITFTGA